MDLKTLGVLPKGKKALGGFTHVTMHLCFDVQFDLRCKARLVTGENLTSLPEDAIYSGVVSIDSDRTALFNAVIYELKIMATDMTYHLSGDCRHNWTKLCPNILIEQPLDM